MRALRLAVPAVFLTACNSGDLFHHSLPVSPTAWKQEDSLQWIVNVKDTVSHYAVWIEVRNDSRFEYRNLAVEVMEYAPDSSLVRRDTLNHFLMDEEGRWTGAGWGSLYTNEFLIDSSLMFARTGDHTFIVRPALTDKKIAGIHSIGLRIGKIE